MDGFSPLVVDVAPLRRLTDALEPLRQRLVAHPLYGSLHTADDLRVFMRHHVFAVWDFMSLLKALQSTCTCTAVPWVPRGDPAVRRLLHEIVLAEESDVDARGEVASHFELYLRAMRSFHVETHAIDAVIAAVTRGIDVREALAVTTAPAAARAFVGETFALLREGGPHTWAAAFTFGREDIIPDMFRRFVDELRAHAPGELADLLWYLDRHIDLDGGSHGALSLRMVVSLCGDDERRWAEATRSAERALRARLALWDGIVAAVDSERSTKPARSTA